ncbi:hypothetical protein H0H93_005355 [Arthromyces matolae]|nr:hypothetical protein H0H93_005355 [Arthromyces matolae]
MAFNSKSALFALLSAALAAAYTGTAVPDALGTTPCPVQCTPVTDYHVALPVTLFPNGENCCTEVNVQYNGVSIAVTFTDLYLAGANSENISLSHQAFAELAAPELGSITPVTWDFA